MRRSTGVLSFVILVNLVELARRDAVVLDLTSDVLGIFRVLQLSEPLYENALYVLLYKLYCCDCFVVIIAILLFQSYSWNSVTKSCCDRVSRHIVSYSEVALS